MDDEAIDAAVGLTGAREWAERHVLEHLRDPEGGWLDMRVKCEGGRWTVTLGETGDGLGSAVGQGASFAEAWHRLTPGWAPQNDNGGGR